MNALTLETLNKLRSLANPSHQEFLKKMVPSQKEVLGIKAPQLRIILTDLKEATQKLSNREKIELAVEWVQTDVHDFGQMAYEFIGFNKTLLAEVTKDDLHRLNHKLDNWASVDAFSVYLHGKAWKLGILSDNDLLQLVKSEDVWQRRIAVVSTIPLNRKVKGQKADPERTFMICDLVLADYADMVVKALSWALRELSKQEPQLVRDYIETHREILHKRVLREVNNKLVFGLKNV
ncbi:MAG: DNA alkylation repair protein [Prolixibacteraceae bacterium]